MLAGVTVLLMEHDVAGHTEEFHVSVNGWPVVPSEVVVSLSCVSGRAELEEVV